MGARCLLLASTSPTACVPRGAGRADPFKKNTYTSQNNPAEVSKRISPSLPSSHPRAGHGAHGGAFSTMARARRAAAGRQWGRPRRFRADPAQRNQDEAPGNPALSLSPLFFFFSSR